ncbi:hypothetical protein C4M96_01860 [Mycoplasmopsis pullorum]|nr:hypothetical protein C4M93_02925 [Mycoplasmopsis pullorum]TNK92173.1 hypothetical protein C4M96_01860 [Mycoplasmopsis pullorum]
MKNFWKNKFVLFSLIFFIIGVVFGIWFAVIIYYALESAFPWYGWIVVPVCVGLISFLLVYGILNLFGLLKKYF